MMRIHSRSSARAAFAALLAASSLALALPAAAQTAQGQAQAADPDRPETTWAAIRGDVFPGGQITDAGDAVRIDAPGRAEDAALVPLTLALDLPKGDPRTLKAVTLIIDENPAPVAGRFAFGEGIRAFSLSVRVRVNSYSWVRAVAETSDGALIMTKAYVKAAGGCSAPATKDTADSIAKLGEIRFRSFADAGRPEAQVQIRHPNFSGLQMDETTRGYTPAWFVREVEVKQGARRIFAMEGGISISEDPTFRFSFTPSAEPVSVRAEDTEGKVFARTFPGNGS